MAGKVIKRGAEAEILAIKLWNEEAVEKHRLSKGYRCKELDEKIRLERTKSESGLLHRAKVLGIRTPSILSIDPEKKSIFMELIEGKKAKDVIKGNVELCMEIGRKIAIMHSSSLIHGDLTTDNILVENDSIVFIDFGLGFYSDKEEDKAVDLINLKKTLLAGNPTLTREWSEIMKAYNAESGIGKRMEKKLAEIEKRARYT